MLPKRRVHLILSVTLSAALLIAAVLLTAAVRHSGAFAQSVYLPFSRAVSGLLGTLFSFSSYTVAEALLVTAAAALAGCLIRSVVHTVRERSAMPLLLWLSGVVLSASGIYFLFILLWGGTYHAPKLESRLGLRTGPQEEEMLFQTASRHLEDVLLYAELVPRNADGEAGAGGFSALAPESARAMKSLMARYPELFGKAAVSPPKRAFSYPVLGMLGISGIYVPFTGEAVVNTISTDPFLPSVMCHELAHRLGFAPEEDANLVAYLACMESNEPIFRYSGALMAFTYCYNALSSQQYRSLLWSRLAEESEETVDDYRRNREEWVKYESPLRQAAEAVNNAYLQSMGQADGVRSYGRVVDMLIALYIEEQARSGP
ncbi:MAG: DUF3810 domain-containing protein [Oscillospiraceae bacterium]|jgi:hypothetical protein|nr:DUF3810 domain-containing protein [Oscillospiraceae bacterium]